MNNGWDERRRAAVSETSAGSTGESEEGLLSRKDSNTGWANSSDFLASTFAFTLSFHSLLSLPLIVLRHGGLAFLLLYGLLLVTIGCPLLLLEMFLGQYSSMSSGTIFHHLCPLLTGLGPALCIHAGARAVIQLATLMWTAQGMYRVFTQMEVKETIFSQEHFNEEHFSLANIGSMDMQLVLILGIVAAVTFLFIIGGIRFVRNICKFCVPACFLLMVTLTIRTCLAHGGSLGVSSFLSPDWSVFTQPTAWVEACCHVIFSLNLGVGGVSTYASYNNYHYNIVRDCLIIVIAHLLWVLQSVVLTFSLLGAAHVNTVSDLSHTQPIGMLGLAQMELGLAEIEFGWLWMGLLFILLLMVGLSSMFGFLQVIITSIIYVRPHYRPFIPVISLLLLCVIFLLSLLLTIPGGFQIHQVLHEFISTVPVLIFSLLTIVATVLCHGTKFLMTDLSDMITIILPHWVTSHLSSIFYTFLPCSLLVSSPHFLDCLSYTCLSRSALCGQSTTCQHLPHHSSA